MYLLSLLLLHIISFLDVKKNITITSIKSKVMDHQYIYLYIYLHRQRQYSADPKKIQSGISILPQLASVPLLLRSSVLPFCVSRVRDPEGNHTPNSNHLIHSRGEVKRGGFNKDVME